MITKDQIAEAMARECDIISHLFTKLTPAAMDYRPSPGQRSTLELLQYLSICGIAGAECMAASDWKLFGQFAERAKAVTAQSFPNAMQQQKNEIAAFFAKTSESSLEKQEAPMPGGGSAPLGLGILNGPFKWLTAYKMQLFLYARANGAEINTANAWAGKDAS